MYEKEQIIKKVLIANRSEISSRIQTACHSNGIETVAIYTQEDQTSPYIFESTENHKLSQNGYAGYLDQNEIISIAQKTNSDAIHPGYGFLSENNVFAQKVIDADLNWIGPDPKSIKLMGNKTAARNIMKNANVPIIPGKSFEEKDFFSAQKFAQKIKYPIMLKASMGGGGKAMRVLHENSEFETAWNIVISESKKFFNSSELIVEKYIKNGRHIEIQIAGDGANVVHMFERECSIQRRNQKIIEETSCNFVSKKTLEKLYATAIAAAQSISYKNIGTVEFIVTPEENFYFLEMNTRLQVEHSVTEATTGIDLVSLQLHIAQHSQLPFAQSDVAQKNHAIECRIYSEDPENNFAPSCGSINILQLPHKPFTRIDHDLEEGKKISPFFDPMIAKITTYGNTRTAAIAHMNNTLRSTVIGGIHTNISFLQNLINSHDFISGNFHTQFLNTTKINEINVQQEKNTSKNTVVKTEFLKIYSQLEQTTNSKNKSNTHNSNWKSQQWQ